MAWKIFNIGKANAEIDAAHTALAAALVGVTSVKIGKDDVAIDDAPLSVKISHVLSAHKASSGDSQKLADALASNEAISGQLSAANDSIASLGKEKVSLNATISDLTNKISDSNKVTSEATEALRTHLATLPGHADYAKDGARANATLAELITAEQNATNAAMAATGMKVEALPAGGHSPEAANTKKPANLTDACLKANKRTA